MTTDQLPPPRGGAYRKHDWNLFASTLQANPGRWIMGDVVSTGVYSNAKYGRVGPLKALPGKVDITSRDNETRAGVRTCRIWGRWTPEGWAENQTSPTPDGQAAP